VQSDEEAGRPTIPEGSIIWSNLLDAPFCLILLINWSFAEDQAGEI